jgi:hypothetical protein
LTCGFEEALKTIQERIDEEKYYELKYCTYENLLNILTAE